jgi:uncharacterized protein (DUF433 family)
MDYQPITTIEPGKRSGLAGIRGIRMTVDDVLEWLASRMTEAEILKDFPYLKRDDVPACLAVPADRERSIVIAREER